VAAENRHELGARGVPIDRSVADEQKTGHDVPKLGFPISAPFVVANEPADRAELKLSKVSRLP
jgi:hypothetical protein